MADLETSSWSETAASNNTATPNGWPEGMLPSDVNNCARENMAALKRDWNRLHPTITSGGTNTITLTYTTAPTAYVLGQIYSFIAGGNNSGATTLNVNGLGAKAVTKQGTTALAGGEILSGAVVAVKYDGTQFQLTEGVFGTTLPTLTNHAVQIGAGTTTATQLAAVALGKFLGSQGTGSDPAYISAVATVKKQAFTGGGTYTPSTGMLYCLILALGGGGGGGGCNTASACAGGGGAGQLSIVLATAATIGASQAVTIGAAGSAGTTTTNGGNGGNTSVGAVAVGNGGTGGTKAAGVGAIAGGAGGTGGTSDIATTGAPGGASNPGAAGGNVMSGQGGSTIFGGGGLAIAGAAGAGTAGTGFGAGGAGASGSNAGGAGTAGVIYIIEFCSQ